MRRIERRKVWLVACAAIAASVPLAPVARAQSGASTQNEEALDSDRPGFGTGTDTVAVGRFQVEAGLSATRRGGTRGYSFGEPTIRTGLGRSTELILDLPTYSRTRASGGTTSGRGDGSLGFKHQFRDDSPEFGLRKPAIAILGAVNVPLGSRGLRGGGVQPTVNLLLHNRLAPRVALTTNLNYSYLKDASRYHEVAAVASLDFTLSKRAGTFIEAYGILPSGARRNTRFVDGGLTYLLNNDTQIDASVGLGLGNDVGGPDFFYGFGVAHRF